MAPKQQARFQPLTCIRQTGTRRMSDGSITYSFVAQVSRDLPAVAITLRVTPSAGLMAEAVFDERVHIEEMGEDNHRKEGLVALP
jgi:hypothetical protein